MHLANAIPPSHASTADAVQCLPSSYTYLHMLQCQMNNAGNSFGIIGTLKFPKL